MRFLREEEAERAMQLFEGSADRAAADSKGISKRALKNWVVSEPSLFLFFTFNY